MKSQLFFSFIVCTVLSSISAGQVLASRDGGPSSSSDPFQRTEYVKAFDQRDIWKKHQKVLKAEELGHLLERDSTTLAMQYARDEMEPQGCFSWLFGCCIKMPAGYQPLSMSDIQCGHGNGARFKNAKYPSLR
jgi:hypothetical protein